MVRIVEESINTPEENNYNNLALEQQFREAQNKNEILQVLKELLDTKNIEVKTDLTSDEIKLITRIKIISELKDIKVYEKGLETYMKLVLSKGRKSRTEILEAIKGYANQSMSLLNRINPFRPKV